MQADDGEVDGFQGAMAPNAVVEDQVPGPEEPTDIINVDDIDFERLDQQLNQDLAQLAALDINAYLCEAPEEVLEADDVEVA